MISLDCSRIGVAIHCDLCLCVDAPALFALGDHFLLYSLLRILHWSDLGDQSIQAGSVLWYCLVRHHLVACDRHQKVLASCEPFVDRSGLLQQRTVLDGDHAHCLLERRECQDCLRFRSGGPCLVLPFPRGGFCNGYLWILGQLGRIHADFKDLAYHPYDFGSCSRSVSLGFFFLRQMQLNRVLDWSRKKHLLKPTSIYLLASD